MVAMKPMTPSLCSHVSVHLLRFATAKTADDLGQLEPPTGTDLWLPMVDVALGENVLADRVGSVWGVVGLHSGGDAADATVADPDESLTTTDDTTESWHAAFDVVGHRGAVDWLDRSSPGLILTPTAENPGGPLAVLTTAGFVLDENFDLTRAQDFAFNTERVREVMSAAPGNVLTHMLSAAEPAGPDGITFTIWQSDAAMRDTAYQRGRHREQIDRYKAEHTADRTSFTRLRVRISSGTWNGVDPIQTATAA